MLQFCGLALRRMTTHWISASCGFSRLLLFSESAMGSIEDTYLFIRGARNAELHMQTNQSSFLQELPCHSVKNLSRNLNYFILFNHKYSLKLMLKQLEQKITYCPMECIPFIPFPLPFSNTILYHIRKYKEKNWILNSISTDFGLDNSAKCWMDFTLITL